MPTRTFDLNTALNMYLSGGDPLRRKTLANRNPRGDTRRFLETLAKEEVRFGFSSGSRSNATMRLIAPSGEDIGFISPNIERWIYGHSRGKEGKDGRTVTTEDSARLEHEGFCAHYGVAPDTVKYRFEPSKSKVYFSPIDYQTAILIAFTDIARESVVSDPSAESGDLVFPEGKRLEVVSRRLERNPQARTTCLEIYGYSCQVCEVNLKDLYQLEAEFIHVHHEHPLSLAEHERLTNARSDLKPVCPNCHAALHTRTPPLTIAELRSRLQRTP